MLRAPKSTLSPECVVQKKDVVESLIVVGRNVVTYSLVRVKWKPITDDNDLI